MEFLTHLLDFVLHLDVHLNSLAGQLGLWFYLVLFLVVFCETGLVVTPLLPGDSLLFALGALCAATDSTLNLPALLVLLLVAAILGDAVNYAIGAYLGPRAFKFDNSWLLNKKHLLRAQEFYERYGSKTIILARFVPIVRTFAPFVAGIGVMRYGKFLAYNVVGAVAWVAICLYAGFFFGQVDWVKRNFELVVVAVILISVLPMAVEMILSWLRTRSPGKLEAVAAGADPVATTGDSLHRAG
jgi:membrane-associated protein